MQVCLELGAKPTCRLSARTCQFDPEQTYGCSFGNKEPMLAAQECIGSRVFQTLNSLLFHFP